MVSKGKVHRVECWELTGKSGEATGIKIPSFCNRSNKAWFRQELSTGAKSGGEISFRNRIYAWLQNVSDGSPSNKGEISNYKMEKLDNTLTRWAVSASRCNIWKENITDKVFRLGRYNLNVHHEEIADLSQMTGKLFRKRRGKILYSSNIPVL